MADSEYSNIEPIQAPAVATTHINWGGVVKGALIITGIAVAAIGGYWLATGGVDMLINAIGGTTPIGPVIDSIGNTITSLFNQSLAGVRSAIGWIGDSLGSLWGSATAEMPIGPVSPATGAAMREGAGWLGAGAAVAVAAKASVAPLSHLHLTDTTTALAASPDATAGQLAAHKSTVASYATAPSHHAAGADVDLPDMPDEALANATAAKTASKVGHLAGEDAADSWTERVKHKVAARRNLLETARATAVKESHVSALEADRAKLDAALGTPTV